MPSSPRHVAALALSLVISLSGCAGAPSPQGHAAGATADTAPDDYGCLTPSQARGAFQLKLSGQSFTTDAFTEGTGKVGIVFAHMAGQTVCEWAPEVSGFAAKGYSALTFSSIGPTDQNIADAVVELKRRGATKVVLVGGSKGGTAALVAASRPQALPVVAVVSLSAPSGYDGMDAAAAVGRLTIPVFLMADADDSGFAQDAQMLARGAIHSPQHPLHLYPGSAHASAVLGDPKALADFDQFISTYAPPAR